MGYFPEVRETKELVIANGESLSTAVDLTDSLVLVGLQMPAAWTAAGITLQASVDGITYGDLKDYAGNEYSLVVTADDYLYLDPAELVSIRYLKVRSGTSGTPVNQAAERTITLLVRPL